jgi:hypothetical protein
VLISFRDGECAFLPAIPLQVAHGEMPIGTKNSSNSLDAFAGNNVAQPALNDGHHPKAHRD